MRPLEKQNLIIFLAYLLEESKSRNRIPSIHEVIDQKKEVNSLLIQEIYQLHFEISQNLL
jgi:hypothetical protein